MLETVAKILNISSLQTAFGRDETQGHELGLAENRTALSAGQSCTVYKIWGLVLHCTNVILCFSNCVKMHPYSQNPLFHLLFLTDVLLPDTSSLKRGLVPWHLAGMFCSCSPLTAMQSKLDEGARVKNMFSDLQDGVFPPHVVPRLNLELHHLFTSASCLSLTQQSECHSTDRVFSFTDFMELLKLPPKLHSLLTKSVFYFC